MGLLYISNNDGSDMRINKEVNSLLKHTNVYFVGIGDKKNCFLNGDKLDIYLINGKRNTFNTIFKQIYYVLKLILTKKIYSIHIINEQLMLFYWPILWWKHTVLDIFDSIFLKSNIKPNSLLLLKFLVYAPVNKILVTDENRKSMMPNFLKKKISVLPNYPPYYKLNKVKKADSDKLTILFFGWLGMNRGGNVAKSLLEADQNNRLIMMGWFSDKETEQLSTHERVDYRGIVPQNIALEVAANECDYILCIYEPINLNNINASPNKIYDAIQVGTPLIINSEVIVSNLVTELNIGVVIPLSINNNYEVITRELKEKKNEFIFSEELKKKYTWDTVENVLLKSHRL